MSEDERFMFVALYEAKAAISEGNKPFGAVVVREGQIIGQGHNLVESDNDPTAHGEVTAIRTACDALGTPMLDGTTLYTTCEPCLMCTSAIVWAGISRVVIGAAWADSPQFHPEKGSLLGMARYLTYPFEYSTGVLRDDCVKLYGGHSDAGS